jgi:NADH dehydrogenase
VVIVGAGFAGLECAKKLNGTPVDVLLLDRHNYHLFTPLLYQVATALLSPSDIAYPIRKVFRGSPNVRFRQAEVIGYDLDVKTVTIELGGERETIAFDYLVLAAGSTTNFFGNRSIAERAQGLKTLGEALELRNHTLACLEEASALEREEQQPLLTFVVVGGGPTGVEYAGALSELLRLVLRREYPDIAVEPRIVLVEGNERVLSPFSEKLSAYAAERLEALGVEKRLGVLVRSLEGHEVVLSDGERIAARTLVWSAGVKPEGVAEVEGVARTERSRRIVVDAHLRVNGRRDVFAVGDIAAVIGDGHELPMISPPAMQGGRYIADYLLAHLADQPDDPVKMAPFRYLDKGTMATIGRNAAVCQVRGLELKGFLGWVAWLVVHIYYLIGFRNRFFVLWSWSWNYILYDRPVRIVMAPRKPPELPA